MERIIKLGVIGCGVAANDYHWSHWKHLQGAQITAVTDLRPELAQAAAVRFNAVVYASHRQLIEEADIDALYILIPPFAHSDQELLAVRRGLPFFVEKPVTLSLQKAQEVVAALRRRPVITSVGYNWRYSVPVERAKAALTERKVAMINGHWLGGAANNTTPVWWGNFSQSGGQFVEQSTHIVDLLRYFGGEIRTVYSLQAKRLVERADFNIADVGALIAEFKSGAIGTVVNACCLPRKSWYAGVDVTAEDIFLKVRHNQLEIHQGGNTEVYSVPDDPTQNPYLREDQTFVDAVRTGEGSTIRSSYSDAVRSLAISLAAHEAMRTQRVVELPADL